jgi:hypothetical protein
MPVAATDQPLYALVTAAPPATVAEVIAVFEQIDACLANTDGLKWFNRLYLEVTRSVDQQPASTWQDPAGLLQLDVVFANFYLRALAGFLSGDADVASSWDALLEARFRPGIDRILFALAGMNAHINHDLAQALVASYSASGIGLDAALELDSPQHADFETVNSLLKALMPQVLTELATDTLGVLAEDTGKVGRVLAFWDMCKARDLAWGFAEQLRGLSGLAKDAALDGQDALTGALGRAILAVG